MLQPHESSKTMKLILVFKDSHVTKTILIFMKKLKLRVTRSKTTSLHIFLTICESQMTLCETARLNVWNGIYTTYKLSRFLHSRFIMFKNIILTTQKTQT